MRRWSGNMAFNSNSSVNRGSGFITVVGAVFAVPGFAVGVSTLRKAVAGNVDVKQIVLGFSMALMFAGAGIGLIVWSRVSANLSARRNETMLQNPGKPWLWRDDWAQGYARSEWKSNATMMTIIGAAFLLFSRADADELSGFPPARTPTTNGSCCPFPADGCSSRWSKPDLVPSQPKVQRSSSDFVRGTLHARRQIPRASSGSIRVSIFRDRRSHIELCEFLRFRVRRQPQPLGADSVARSENCHCVE